jgi:hypothetical protein
VLSAFALVDVGEDRHKIMLPRRPGRPWLWISTAGVSAAMSVVLPLLLPADLLVKPVVLEGVSLAVAIGLVSTCTFCVDVALWQSRDHD